MTELAASVATSAPTSADSGASSTPSNEGSADALSSPDVPEVSDNAPSEPKAEARKFKLKAQGREMELSEEELLKHASMGLSAQEKWQEAATLRKQNEAFLRELKTNPLSILQNPALGIDMQNIAMEYLAKQIDQELLSPEERRIREMEQELDGYRSKSKAEQERLQQEQAAKADQEWAQNTKASVVDGLKSSGLPYTQFTWNSTLQYMAAAIDAGYEDVTPDQVMHLVKRDYQQAFESFYQLPPEELLQHLGEQNINKIQQAVIGKAKGTGFQPPKKEAEANPSKSKPLSYREQIDAVKQKLKRGELD